MCVFVSVTDARNILYAADGVTVDRGRGGVNSPERRPECVVCVSARWVSDSDKVKVMSNPYPKTVHDFFGFAECLNEVPSPALPSHWVVAPSRAILPAIKPTAVSNTLHLDSVSLMERLPHVQALFMTVGLDISKRSVLDARRMPAG